jgi:FkbM family methyltransferase
VGIQRYYRHREWKAADRFLSNVRGVIHVGANTGQERAYYGQFGLRVLWIEPIPHIFEILKSNLKEFPKQFALRGLITDKDGGEYDFHIANNEGESSSILEMKLHKDIWPEVAFTETIALRGTTLASLLRAERVNIADYDALIMDTQGSELLVLKGAAAILPSLRYIKTEVADFESYEGCCQVEDISRFLRPYGFREFSRQKFASRQTGGDYYDIVYKRVRRPRAA